MIYLWRKPSWLARLCCKLMLKSDFFEVNSDPSFAVENINVNNDVTLLSVVDDSNCEVKPH